MEKRTGGNESNVGGQPPAGGVCAAPDVDPDLFLPKQDGELQDGYERRAMLAKRLCKGCVVQTMCFRETWEFEISPPTQDEVRSALGIRGATTDEDRRLLRSKSARPYSGR